MQYPISLIMKQIEIAKYIINLLSHFPSTKFSLLPSNLSQLRNKTYILCSLYVRKYTSYKRIPYRYSVELLISFQTHEPT